MISRVEPKVASVALKAIYDAFPRASFPADATVTQKGEWFDEKGQSHVYRDPEAELVARFFAGTPPWMDISGEELLRWPPANVSVFLLSPQALAFYIPAYMKAFLTLPLDPVAFGILHATISALTAPDVADDERFREELEPSTRTDAQRRALEMAEVSDFQHFANELNVEQKAAISAFLNAVEPFFEEEYMENHVRTALDRYWGRYQKR